MSNTSFARWRKRMDLTQEGAARLLDVSLRTAQHWDVGKTSAGAVSVPPLAVRIAMAALLRDPGIEAWPGEVDETAHKVVTLGKRRR